MSACPGNDFWLPGSKKNESGWSGCAVSFLLSCSSYWSEFSIPVPDRHDGNGNEGNHVYEVSQSPQSSYAGILKC